jgi:hypothetical protein
MPVEPAFTYSSHTWLHVLSRSTSRTSSKECPFMPIAANLRPVREAVSLPMKRSIATGLPRMEEAETIEDDELVVLARKVPSEKRHIAFDLLKTLLDGAATETIRRVKGTPHQPGSRRISAAKHYRISSSARSRPSLRTAPCTRACSAGIRICDATFTAISAATNCRTG